jgi:hypothetical protein
MASAVYLLCAVASLISAGLLFRSFRRQPSSLLFWSTLCFVGLAANNVLLFVDLAVVSSVSLELLRSLIAVSALGAFLVGLIWVVR